MPFDRVVELYRRWPLERSFEEDMSAHISTGYVVSTPDYFLMARGVDRFAPEEELADPWRGFERQEENAWLIYSFAGSSRNFLSFVPYPLKWVGFARRGRGLKFYDYERITRICAYTIHSKIRS